MLLTCIAFQNVPFLKNKLTTPLSYCFFDCIKKEPVRIRTGSIYGFLWTFFRNCDIINTRALILLVTFGFILRVFVLRSHLSALCIQIATPLNAYPSWPASSTITGFSAAGTLAGSARSVTRAHTASSTKHPIIAAVSRIDFLLSFIVRPPFVRLCPMYMTDGGQIFPLYAGRINLRRLLTRGKKSYIIK